MQNFSSAIRLYNPYRHFLTTITLLLGLTSCASSSVGHLNDSSANLGATESSCEPPTQYALNALKWTDAARDIELQRLAKSLESLNDLCGVLEFAIFLSTPTVSYQDDKKAILLFDKLLADERLSATEQNFIEQIRPHIVQRQDIRQMLESLRQK